MSNRLQRTFGVAPIDNEGNGAGFGSTTLPAPAADLFPARRLRGRNCDRCCYRRWYGHRHWSPGRCYWRGRGKGRRSTWRGCEDRQRGRAVRPPAHPHHDARPPQAGARTVQGNVITADRALCSAQGADTIPAAASSVVNASYIIDFQILVVNIVCWMDR